MAKNRNKKTKHNSTSMDISTSDAATTIDVPQAMDTTEGLATTQPVTASIRKVKKGVQMKRSKNVRKMKAIAKAVSQIEKSATKVMKNEGKTLRTKSAKKLYD